MPCSAHKRSPASRIASAVFLLPAAAFVLVATRHSGESVTLHWCTGRQHNAESYIVYRWLGPIDCN